MFSKDRQDTELTQEMRGLSRSDVGQLGLRRGQGREKWTNGTFSTYDYTRMTLLITVPYKSGSVRVVPTGLLPSAFKTSPHNTTHTQKRGRKKNHWCVPCWLIYAPITDPVPICHWSVPLRRKWEGLQVLKLKCQKSQVRHTFHPSLNGDFRKWFGGG